MGKGNARKDVGTYAKEEEKTKRRRKRKKKRNPEVVTRWSPVNNKANAKIEPYDPI